MAIIRLGIDGRWNAGEFAELLMDLQEFYAFGYIASRIPEIAHSHGLPPERTLGALQTIPKMLNSRSLYSFVQPHELELQLLRVRYGSMGFTDLLGVGKITETLKDFVLRIIELGVSHGERQQKVTAMRIDNAHRMAALAKDLGYSKKEIQNMVRWVDVRQKNVLQLVREGKLVEVSIREDSEIAKESRPEVKTLPEITGRKFRE